MKDIDASLREGSPAAREVITDALLGNDPLAETVLRSLSLAGFAVVPWASLREILSIAYQAASDYQSKAMSFEAGSRDMYSRLKELGASAYFPTMDDICGLFNKTPEELEAMERATLERTVSAMSKARTDASEAKPASETRGTNQS